MNLIYITAITTGLLGSLHCIGMCGPICLSLPFNQGNTFQKLASVFLYNIGRITTYSFIGLLFGIFGKTFELIGLQQIVSILSGALIIAFILFHPALHLNILPEKLLFSLKKTIFVLFKQRRFAAMFLTGLLNGLLPCGLVYLAVVGALATGSPVNGAFYMLLFGLGTLPVMLSLPFAGSFLIRFSMVKKAIPAFMMVVGLLLILRGLNLGIPMISPQYENTETVNCCHKIQN